MEWFIQHRVLHGAYRSKEEVPEEIHRIAVIYEGFLPNCTGWNMPADFAKKHASPTSPLRTYLQQVDYLIVYPKTDLQTKKHELLHALYAMNPSYRQQVRDRWNSLPHQDQERVRHTLLRLGYPDRPDLLLDEFQAYYYTEKRSFFGIGDNTEKRSFFGMSAASHGIGIGTSKRVPGKGK